MRAMVLSAGYGTRLGALTTTTPKPMLSLNGQPMLEYILRHLASQGFDEIAINLHFMPEAIRSHFGDGSRLGIKLTYSFEETLLGTAGAVKKLEGFFKKGRPFLVYYGDILTDQDFSEMTAFHRIRKAEVTMMLHRRIRSNSAVKVEENGRISEFHERPKDYAWSESEPTWVNSGICLCEPEVLDVIPEGTVVDFPRHVFPKIMDRGGLYGFPLTGYRCAVDSPERLIEARAAMAAGSCYRHLVSGKAKLGSGE